MSLIELFTYIFTLLGLFLIVIFISSKNIESRVNRTFILFGLAVFLYSASTFISELNISMDLALLVTRFSVFFANFIPLFFFHFALSYSNTVKKNKTLLRISYAAIPILSVLAFLPYTVISIQRTENGTTLDDIGFGLWLTLVYFVVLFALSFKILYQYGKASTPEVRSQVRLMTYGIGFAVAVNMVVQIILPTFGIKGLGDLIGNPSNLVLVGAVALAILRHRMFDIRAVLIRSIGFAFTAVVIIVGYIVLIWGLTTNILPLISDSRLHDIFLMCVSAILVLSLGPLIKLTKKITDSLFYRDDYDPQDVVNAIGKIVSSIIDLQVLTTKVNELLCREMRVKAVNTIVLDRGSIYYQSTHNPVVDSKQLETDLVQFEKGLYLKDNLEPSPQKTTLERYSIHALAVLQANKQKVGYLLFFEKSNGTSYSRKDGKLIEIVSDELAVAINNSLSYSLVQRFNVTLQKRVDEATEQLRDANTQLKAADEVKDDFISMASHQLTTPLAAVEGYLSMAVKGFYGQLNEPLSEPLISALSRARVMKKLVVDLLSISRMSAGKFHLDLSTVDLNELVKTEVTEFQPTAKGNQTKLVYHAPEVPIPPIEVDGQKLRQAVSNLIDNAIQYTPNGSVNVYLEQRDGWAIYMVVDSGIGVPDHEKPKLFSKFFRADNAKRERPDGTGIGLYVVKRIIDAHNGQLIFKSKAGEGSVFGFEIPLNQPALSDQVKNAAD